jgi:hypothetical protein
MLTGSDVRIQRVTAGLSGHLVCLRSGITRTRLSAIERGHVIPPDVELRCISNAIADIVAGRARLAKLAAEAGLSPEEARL